ncbi:MAG: transaldolase, partial [Candidatus Zixiibacteriota bacterium]
MKSHDGLTIHAGSLEQPFSSALVRAREERFIERLFEHDADVFGKSGEALASIQNRLGWLTIASEMKPRLAELETFATEVMNDGIKHVLVLGMGGSSLAPELISLIFGPRAGLLSVGALDTTDPAAIRTTLEAHDISQTLFIVASKSGRTVETLSHARFFFDLVQKTDVGVPGSRFVAITDKGSDLEAMASERSFRHTFINPADIGGRYSALSYFGLVPAVFTGAKIERLVESAVTAENACSRTDIENNSAFRLGALWSVGADRGIDKLTFVTGGSLEPFVPWVEQLVAESTGKEGNGVIPIEGEPTGEFADYGEDRLFVFMSLKGESSAEKDDLERAAIASGAPCVSIQMERLEDLGFEFLRQEVATATAGYIMGINPFDEPNVSESKNNTATILKDFEETGSFPHPKIITAWDGREVAELGDASTYD